MEERRCHSLSPAVSPLSQCVEKMNISEKSLAGKGRREREKRNSNRNEKGTCDPTDSKNDIQGISGIAYISKFDMQLSNGSILQNITRSKLVLFY